MASTIPTSSSVSPIAQASRYVNVPAASADPRLESNNSSPTNSVASDESNPWVDASGALKEYSAAIHAYTQSMWQDARFEIEHRAKKEGGDAKADSKRNSLSLSSRS